MTGVKKDEALLVDSSAAVAEQIKTGTQQALKYASLVTLTVQNAALNLTMRMARTQRDLFIASTAVIMAEMIKLATCLVMVRVDEGSFQKWRSSIHRIVVLQPWDTLKVAVPSLVYNIQNNLLYVGATHLDAATCQGETTMKLIRWVELHIGRSRKRAKKTAQQESPGFPSESSLLLSHANLDVEPREGNHLPGHIRTRFQGLASPARQRSRIKTNPWIAQSPRSSADTDSSKARAPRGDRWSSEVGSLRSRAATDQRPVSDLQVPESACHARRLVTGISGSSDDEAYSEDFLQSEDSSDAVATVGTSQTDSACGSSCITTPLSECSSQLEATETLADKVRRLQVHRALVEEKMHEARVEEQASRHQRMRFHRELMQFRRLELLHSLQELRSDLEQRAAFENT